MIFSCGTDVGPPGEGAPSEPQAPPSATAAPPVSGPVPPALRAAFIASVQRGAPEGYRLRPDGPGRARGLNEAHGLDALFDEAGLVVSEARGAWQVSLTTEGVGCEEEVEPLPGAPPEASENRVEYPRGGVVEWYMNGPLGIEQGFGIAERPACSGTKRIALRIEGDLDAELEDKDGDGRGEAVSLRDGEGRLAIRYADLFVRDAGGEPVPAWLSLSPSPGEARLSIHIDDRGAAYPLEVDPLIATPQAKLLTPDGEPGDQASYAVAIDGDTALLGAPTDSNLNGFAAGAVYVFVRSGGVWTLQEKLLGSAGDRLGVSVAISGDTAIAAAAYGGSLSSGAAYVYERSGGVWTEEASFPCNALVDCSEANFAASVAISGDIALVGAPGTGSNQGSGMVQMFLRDGGGWHFYGLLLPPGGGTWGDHFGWSVAIDGNRALVGAPEHPFSGVSRGSGSRQGAAYVFVYNGTDWSFEEKLRAFDRQSNDRFGLSVALSGTTAVIGSPYETNANGQAGSAYFFARISGLWTDQGKILASDGMNLDHFGESVAVNGDTAVIAAPFDDNAKGVDAGGAYVFQRSGGVWTEQTKILASDGAANDTFGGSVGVSADAALVGAVGHDANGLNSGAAYVFGLQVSLGSACSGGLQCASGQCVDGVCCDTACGGGVAGDCMACSVAAGALVNGTCGVAAAGTTCRGSVGACDAAEVCDGSSNACPADGLAAAGTQCRAAADVCDVAEVCNGSGNACPADTKAAAGTQCRGSAGACDIAEACDGSSDACPADVKVSAGTGCRPSAGACDSAEACDGSGDVCPPDVKLGAASECRPAAGPCDLADVCNGSSDTCPGDAKVAAGTECRASAGVCDLAEVCNGVNNACPADTKVAAGSTCRASTGPCDVADACDGSGASCPADAKAAAGTGCRPAAGA
ncbi:MAG TPA: hypothetical protein VE093_49800, partial [Polyangiaceae bacterium]|nr:hypothetical protein [Polyangiaceae bacterium]